MFECSTLSPFSYALEMIEQLRTKHVGTSRQTTNSWLRQPICQLYGRTSTIHIAASFQFAVHAGAFLLHLAAPSFRNGCNQIGERDRESTTAASYSTSAIFGLHLIRMLYMLQSDAYL